MINNKKYLFTGLIKRENLYASLGAGYDFFLHTNRVFEIQKFRHNHSLRPNQYKYEDWILHVVIN